MTIAATASMAESTYTEISFLVFVFFLFFYRKQFSFIISLSRFMQIACLSEVILLNTVFSFA